MRVRFWLLLAFLGGGCIDLSQPPELKGPGARGDAGEPVEAGSHPPDAAADLATGDLAPPIGSPDAAVVAHAEDPIAAPPTPALPPSPAPMIAAHPTTPAHRAPPPRPP